MAQNAGCGWPLFGTVVAATQSGCCGGPWGWGPMGLGGPFMMIFAWLFWIAIIALVVGLIAKSRRPFRKADQQPIEILKQRYAKGEISKEDFERMKKDILS